LKKQARVCRRSKTTRDLTHLKNFDAGVRTIDDLARTPYLVAANRQIKSLVYLATIDGEPRPVLALLRGDHQLHDVKFWRRVRINRDADGASGRDTRIAGSERRKFGRRGRDSNVAQIESEATHHRGPRLEGPPQPDGLARTKTTITFRGVDVERDIEVDQWADLRTVNSGESCPRCDTGTLEVFTSCRVEDMGQSPSP